MEHESNNADGDGTDREVNIETPPTGNMVRESPPDERPKHARNPIGKPDEGGVHGTPFWLRNECNDCIDAGADARGAEACDGAPEDENCGAGGDGAENAANLEDEYGKEEDDLEGEIFICFSPWRIGRHRSS